MDWHEKAICVGADPDLFFPVGHSGSAPVRLQTARAKAVCRRCLVREQCLAWALRHEEADGIWGGTTEGERRAMAGRPAHRFRDAA
ncbi:MULTISPECIES: WhiB family transcriptional regulator [Streptomyces]|uniref:WhiB family transcriptional regulator n=1 Tax=Streptomyces TaxID=1883 RepID=UPI00240DAEAE|nr:MULTISPECIES: WhiB family transcriptional regulator [Streptomyces]WFB88476.1 WhiB family transcriptional regulator [Streptomyces olivaceus]WGK50919.1 WhiB family transcriptional regulator [Streptomyces sp. B146]